MPKVPSNGAPMPSFFGPPKYGQVQHLMLCVSDGNTNSATALRGSYGCAMIHEVNAYYDSSPFVSRPATEQSSHALADVTLRTNNTQPADALSAGRKGYYTLFCISVLMCV